MWKLIYNKKINKINKTRIKLCIDDCKQSSADYDKTKRRKSRTLSI